MQTQRKKTKIGYKWAIFKVTGLNTRELKPNLKLVVPQGFYKRCAFLSFCLIPIYHSSACLVSSRQNKYSIFTIASSLFRFFLDVIIYLFVSHLFVFQKLYPLFLSVMLTPDGAKIFWERKATKVFIIRYLWIWISGDSETQIFVRWNDLVCSVG